MDPFMGTGAHGVTPEVFEDYDTAAEHVPALQQSKVHAGSFAPIGTGHPTAAASAIDRCISSVSATAAPTLGPSVPPSSRLFADLVLEGSGSGGAGTLSTTNMGHFSAMSDPLPELLPTDDEEEDPMPEPQRPELAAATAVPPPVPTATFSRCGVGASPYSKSALLTAAVICTIFFPAAGITTAAELQTIPVESDFPTTLFFTRTQAFPPCRTTFGSVCAFSIPHVLHHQFACAVHYPSTPRVVYCGNIPGVPPWEFTSGYFFWTYLCTLDWFWTLGLGLVTFLASGISWYWASYGYSVL
ncbi:hypothetical protein CYMTET_24506 [Cymbomonas tetramitiformis]|uniref:Transmembrane protein n=1 Tax=Cymbomonas tetramitiformis TaxID=36881 RepID=A0AAE0FWH3_9CHLO|nr:hypothetical protein CYMTET_24506 [Cymbomonas tetramitiformis]